MSKFHYIARALIMDSDSVLVAQDKDASNTFLPGGHIEFGEGAQEAVIREIKEEIGMESQVSSFLGAVEHLWPEDTKDNHEINLVFRVVVLQLNQMIEPVSKESHIEFFWAPVSKLREINLQPSPLITLIKKFSEEPSFWGSTILEASRGIGIQYE